jgi:hypothetical protein
MRHTGLPMNTLKCLACLSGPAPLTACAKAIDACAKACASAKASATRGQRRRTVAQAPAKAQ